MDLDNTWNISDGPQWNITHEIWGKATPGFLPNNAKKVVEDVSLSP